MGNYSYISNQTGCELDFEKLKQEMERLGIADYLDDEQWKLLKDEGLGELMNGWKIQGYWYDDYCKFLYACLLAMKYLTQDNWDNQIEMEEEQGFSFWINFYIDKDTQKPTLRIDYVPMTTYEFYLNEDGKQIDKTGKLCVDE